MSGFRVVASERVRQELRLLIVKATLEEREEEVFAAYEEIARRLQDDPLEFGEARYLLREMNLLVRRGAVAPLLVNYGVNAQHRFVVVQAFSLMSR